MGTPPFDLFDFFGYLIAGFVLIAGLAYVMGLHAFPKGRLRNRDIAVLVIGAYVLGQAVSWPANWLFESRLLFAFLGTPDRFILTDPCGPRGAPIGTGQSMKAVTPATAAGPGAVLCAIFGSYYRPLLTAPEAARIATFARRNGIDPAKSGELFKFVRYHPLVQTQARLVSRLDEFSAKSIFCRNVALVLLLTGLLLPFRAPISRLVSSRFPAAWPSGASSRIDLACAGIALALAVVLVFRHLFFFRQYNAELFSSFAGLVLSAPAIH